MQSDVEVRAEPVVGWRVSRLLLTASGVWFSGIALGGLAGPYRAEDPAACRCGFSEPVHADEEIPHPDGECGYYGVVEETAGRRYLRRTVFRSPGSPYVAVQAAFWGRYVAHGASPALTEELRAARFSPLGIEVPSVCLRCETGRPATALGVFGWREFTASSDIWPLCDDCVGGAGSRVSLAQVAGDLGSEVRWSAHAEGRDPALGAGPLQHRWVWLSSEERAMVDRQPEPRDRVLAALPTGVFAAEHGVALLLTLRQRHGLSLPRLHELGREAFQHGGPERFERQLRARLDEAA